jgi:hypothetical protein
LLPKRGSGSHERRWQFFPSKTKFGAVGRVVEKVVVELIRTHAIKEAI